MITINIDKAKTIAHDIRRAARAEEFKPHDEIIMKQIPGVDAAAAESHLPRDRPGPRRPARRNRLREANDRAILTAAPRA